MKFQQRSYSLTRILRPVRYTTNYKILKILDEEADNRDPEELHVTTPIYIWFSIILTDTVLALYFANEAFSKQTR